MPLRLVDPSGLFRIFGEIVSVHALCSECSGVNRVGMEARQCSQMFA